MSLDINLFGNEGFQEQISQPEPIEEAEKEEKDVKKVTKKSRSFPVQEFGAIVIAVVIGALIWWYLMLKTTVKSEISEHTPLEFKMKYEMRHE